MSRIFVALSLLVIMLALACSKGGTTPAAPPTPGATPSATATAVAPVSTPAATATPAEPTPVPFFLNGTEPKDESVVSSSSVQVKGSTTTDAVVSVNGQAVDVDAAGNFTISVRLQEGPNSIDVIASNFQGDSESQVINLIFLP